MMGQQQKNGDTMDMELTEADGLNDQYRTFDCAKRATEGISGPMSQYTNQLSWRREMWASSTGDGHMISFLTENMISI